ncbi:MAG: PDDEXK nuclease domain-containing protein [Elusimicrobiota bacterium]
MPTSGPQREGSSSACSAFCSSSASGSPSWGGRCGWRWEARISSWTCSSITTRLRCFVVVELKAGAFKPEYAGKMNFYLAVVDDRMRHTEDRPSIGMILCRSKNRVAVEYSLHAAGKPIGVASYTLEKELPRELKGALPAPEDLERALLSEK